MKQTKLLKYLIVFIGLIIGISTYFFWRSEKSFEGLPITLVLEANGGVFYTVDLMQNEFIDKYDQAILFAKSTNIPIAGLTQNSSKTNGLYSIGSFELLKNETKIATLNFGNAFNGQIYTWYGDRYIILKGKWDVKNLSDDSGKLGIQSNKICIYDILEDKYFWFNISDTTGVTVNDFNSISYIANP